MLRAQRDFWGDVRVGQIGVTEDQFDAAPNFPAASTCRSSRV
jgi:hypothetical protein